jgi:hypothetical protein
MRPREAAALLPPPACGLRDSHIRKAPSEAGCGDARGRVESHSGFHYRLRAAGQTPATKPPLFPLPPLAVGRAGVGGGPESSEAAVEVRDGTTVEQVPEPSPFHKRPPPRPSPPQAGGGRSAASAPSTMIGSRLPLRRRTIREGCVNVVGLRWGRVGGGRAE